MSHMLVRRCHICRWMWGGKVFLLAGLERSEIVLPHLQAILMLVCLKMFVIFLTCREEYVKVAHLVPLLEGVGLGDLGKELFCCSVQCVICVAITYLVVLCGVGVTAFY